MIILFKNLSVLASWRENSKAWCRRLLVLSVALITIASVIPHGFDAKTIIVVFVGLDKIVHFLGFACLLLLAFATSKHLSFWRGVRLAAYVLIFGAAIEFVQCYIPYRTFNPVDILANLCGVVFGVLIWIIIVSAERRAQRAWREAHGE